MLTIKKLKAMAPDTIFASGIELIEHPWFNDAKKSLVNEKGEPDENGKMVKVKWIAIRGGIHDWAIYHSLDANFVSADYLDDTEHINISEERIARLGAKIHREEFIKKLVPCTDEAFKMYRH